MLASPIGRALVLLVVVLALGLGGNAPAGDEDLLRPLREGRWADVKKKLAQEPVLLRFRGEHDQGLLTLALRQKAPVEFIEYLLGTGANVDQQDEYGVTPLLFAVINNDKDAVTLLLAKGANVNLKTKAGSNALHYSVYSQQVTEQLLTAGIAADAVDGAGRNPLHYMAMMGDAPAKQLALLIEKGVPVAVKDQSGNTPLLYALSRGRREHAKLLAETGKGLAMEDNSLMTPLHWAVMRRWDDIVQILLAKGAPVNTQDRAGDTPLHGLLPGDDPAAAERILKLLLQAGADPKIPNKRGDTGQARIDWLNAAAKSPPPPPAPPPDAPPK